MTQLYISGYFDSKIWTIDLSDKKMDISDMIKLLIQKLLVQI